MLPGKIAGVGSYVPRKVFTNEFIAAMVPGVVPEWTREHLGITERRIAAKGETPGEMAANAGRAALEAAGIHASELDLIVVATSSTTIPPIASAVQSKLSYVNCPAIDLNAVCSGFMAALVMAYQLLPHYGHILVVGVDTFSRITDWTNRNCVFFGDGAGAVVVSRDDGRGMVGHFLGGAPDRQGAFGMDGGGKWQMDSKAVFEAAIRALPIAIDRVLDEAGLSPANITHVIPHQSSLDLLKAIAARCELPFEIFRLTMDRYANTSAATIPLTLDAHKDAIKMGDRILFFGIGAGWNWGAAVVEW